MANKKEPNSNMKLAGLFLALVLGLIVISIFLKLIFVLNSSKFDGVHRFTVGFISENKVKVVSFSPQSRAIAILKIAGYKKNENLSDLILYPVDALVHTDNQSLDKKDVSSMLTKSLLSINNPDSNLTSFDNLKLLLFAKRISSDSIFETNFSPNLSSQEKSYIFTNYFQDNAINQENTTIEIINAASSFGLGGKLAALITNIGGNVVLLSTSDNEQVSSKIVYSMPKNYTLKKFSSFLGIPMEKTDVKGVADMTIIIGKDSLRNLKF